MTDGGFRLRDSAFSIYAPSLLYAIGQGAVLPVIALSARDLGASVATAALVITLIGIGSLLTNVPAAMLTSRIGERTSIILAAAWASAGMGLALLAGSLPVFGAGILMVGMAGSVFNLARQSYLAVAVPATHRARAMSTLGGVMRIGVFIGPFAGAGAMALLGIGGAYWTGLAAMLAAGAVSFRIPELSPHPAGPGAAAGTQPTRPRRTMRSVAAAHWRTLATVGIGVVLISAVRATRQAVIPLWCEQIGLNPAAASLVYGLSGAVDMLVFYPAGKLMDTRGRSAVAVPCMAVMGVALVLLPFTAGPGTLLAAAMLLGFGNGIGSGIVMTLGADYSPADARPQFLGLWRLMSDVGVMAGPVVLSAVTGLATLAAGVWVVAGLAFLGAIVLGRTIPRKPEPGR